MMAPGTANPLDQKEKAGRTGGNSEAAWPQAQSFGADGQLEMQVGSGSGSGVGWGGVCGGSASQKK